VGAVVGPRRWMIKKNCSSRLVSIPGEAPVNESICPFVSTTDAQAVEYGWVFSGHKPISPHCISTKMICEVFNYRSKRSFFPQTLVWRVEPPLFSPQLTSSKGNEHGGKAQPPNCCPVPQGACLYVTPVTHNKRMLYSQIWPRCLNSLQTYTCYFYSKVYTKTRELQTMGSWVTCGSYPRINIVTDTSHAKRLAV
jgi:hypothetical protein